MFFIALAIALTVLSIVQVVRATRGPTARTHDGGMRAIGRYQASNEC